MRPEPRLETEKKGKLDAPVKREEAWGKAKERAFLLSIPVRASSPRRGMFVQD